MEISTWIGSALFALIPGFIAKKRGRSFWGYFFLSFILSPLVTIIIVLCRKNLNKEQHDERPADTSKKPAAAPAEPHLSNTPGWQCSCGRSHPRYESSCVCGRSKTDNMVTATVETRIPEPVTGEDKILFCRKCGEKLIENSRFCRKCGTEVVKG